MKHTIPKTNRPSILTHIAAGVADLCTIVTWPAEDLPPKALEPPQGDGFTEDMAAMASDQRRVGADMWKALHQATEELDDKR